MPRRVGALFFGLEVRLHVGAEMARACDDAVARGAARRVELPTPSLRGNTTFRLKGHEDASVVVLTGSFNEWNQSQLLFGREGNEWVCRIDLDPGVYRYKFIVDGDWLLDPSNPDTAEDEAGNVNNVLEVKRQ